MRPVARPTLRPPRSSPERSHPPDVHGDVLVVAGDLAARERLLAVLSEVPTVATHVVATGREALLRLAWHRADFILALAELPDMTGAELLDRARAIEPAAKLILVRDIA